MNLFRYFFPDSYVSSVYLIDFSSLYKRGFRGILFDIDNTLVPHGARADLRSKKLFKKLKRIGFKTVLLSNNKEKRVENFSDEAGADEYVFKAAKPLKSGYLRAMDAIGTAPESTILVGDQLFTDIWGAKRLGIFSILTEPVQKWKEEPQIIAKRFLEFPFLLYYLLFKPFRQRD